MYVIEFILNKRMIKKYNKKTLCRQGNSQIWWRMRDLKYNLLLTVIPLLLLAKTFTVFCQYVFFLKFLREF